MELTRDGARGIRAAGNSAQPGDLPRADRKRQSPVIAELIRSLARRHELDFFDLSDAFDGLEPSEFRVSAWDRHPSALGHVALFESLRAELLRRGSLPGLLLGTAATTPRGSDLPGAFCREAAQLCRERAMSGASSRTSRSRCVRT